VQFVDLDLGWQVAGAIAEVTMLGVESDVMLMVDADILRFQAGQSVRYWGGHYKRSPVRIRVPSAGHWHAVVVPGLGKTVTASGRVLQSRIA